MMILSLLLATIFAILGILHISWFFGGSLGFDSSLPTKENGERVLNPRKIDTASVGLGLLGFAAFYFFKSAIIDVALPNWLIQYGGWVILSIFILRAIGEFKYVGFFKKVKSTQFGKLDTKFFSPLCLAIGITGIAIELLK